MAGRTEDVAVPARAMYLAAVAGVGVLLLSAHFVYVWAPIAQWFPAREALARIAGGVMVVAALGLLSRTAVVPSSVVVGVLFLGWLVLVQVPRILAKPREEALWAGAARIATVVAGAWILHAVFASPTDGAGRWLRGERGVRAARVLYALALPLFGLHHFVDLAGAAEAVPAWLPFRFFWGWFTGVAHVAAGVAILVGIAPRLAAVLEATMVTAFVLLVHVPGVKDAPTDGLQWTMLFVAATIGGAGWIVARSYEGR